MNIPHIEHALEHITTACEARLTELYPHGVPDLVRERYKKEMAYLSQSEYIDDFEIFRLMTLAAKKSATLIRGRVLLPGSIIYYLLGDNCLNPLPVHYYCPKCGHFEMVNTHLFGIDLPEKGCPKCGAMISADGFNLPPESVWGNDGKKIVSFEHNVSADFRPFARKVLESLYPDNQVIPWGMFQMDYSKAEHPSLEEPISIAHSGYVILPAGNVMNDYPNLVSYLDTGEPCIAGSSWELRDHMLKPIYLLSLKYLDDLLRLQRTTGIYANEISFRELKDLTWKNIHNSMVLGSSASIIFSDMRPKTWKDMVAIEASTHNTTIHQNNPNGVIPYRLMLTFESVKKYPCFTREDFFDYMIEAGVERSFAFDVSERIRKGHSNSPKKRDSFMALPIPEEIKEVAANYMYIFPRAHCVEYMLIYARLAYYAKIDGRTYSRILSKK